MSSNRSLGVNFERRFCELLRDHGFWVLQIPQNSYGQPADVIAVKNDNPYLIDCKVCSRDSFARGRIEPNQKTSMEMWQRVAFNRPAWFALYLLKSDEIYMVPYPIVSHLFISDSLMSKDMIMEYGSEILEWLRQHDNNNSK